MTLTKQGPLVRSPCGDYYPAADAAHLFGLPAGDLRAARDGARFQATRDKRLRCPTHGDDCPHRNH